MKKHLVLFIAFMPLLACKHQKSNDNSTRTDSAKIVNQNPNHLKTEKDYTEIFLDGDIDKVNDLLGTPDVKRESPNRVNGYYVYYEKVWDEGRAKHLVIAYHDDKVVRIKSAIFGEHIALPAGTIEIERPAGYQSEGTNPDNEIHKIENLYTSVDTVHNVGFLDAADGFIYHTYRVGNLILFKQMLPGNGDTSYTEYLFVDGKVRFKYCYDQLKESMIEKVYISYNGNVIKYLRGGKDTPCDKNEYCKYDELSTPYYLLKNHGSN